MNTGEAVSVDAETADPFLIESKNLIKKYTIQNQSSQIMKQVFFFFK